MMRNKLYSAYNRCLSLFFPDRCALCDSITDTGKFVCDTCDKAFIRNYRQTKVGSFTCYSVCDYGENPRTIVMGAKKHRDFSKLCFMANEMYELMKAYDMPEADVIIPVPMGFVKRITRGYNHTEKLARHLSYLSGIKTVKALRKVKKTKEQKSLKREQRLENLKGSYAIDKKRAVSGKTVLVIDDVSTTGTTLFEVASVLQKEGNRVICIVFAKTPLEKRE